MPAETMTSFENSSDFLNHSQNPNYFTMCINQPIRIQIWIGYSAFCFLFGFSATLMVLRELYQRRRQKNTNDFFVLNLTINDLIFLTFLPFNVTNYKVWHLMALEPVCNFIYSISLSGRPLFMACVCGDYYFAVVHPIIYRTSKRTDMIRKTIAMMIWLFIICLGYLIASNPWMFTTVIASIPLLIALPAIGFFDITVFCALRKKDPSGRNTVHPQKKRAMRTIISSFVMTFAVYLPPAVIFVIGNDMQLSNTQLYYCVFNFFAVCLSMSGCVIMPVLYLESIGQLNVRKMSEKIHSFTSSFVHGN